MAIPNWLSLCFLGWRGSLDWILWQDPAIRRRHCLRSYEDVFCLMSFEADFCLMTLEDVFYLMTFEDVFYLMSFEDVFCSMTFEDVFLFDDFWRWLLFDVLKMALGAGSIQQRRVSFYLQGTQNENLDAGDRKHLRPDSAILCLVVVLGHRNLAKQSKSQRMSLLEMLFATTSSRPRH